VVTGGTDVRQAPTWDYFCHVLLPAPLPQPRIHSWAISGEAHVAHLPLSIAERMRAAAVAALGGEARIDARALRPGEAIGTGGAITLWAESGACVLGASCG
jgi:RNA 3'-terminal phosphate cyclase